MEIPLSSNQPAMTTQREKDGTRCNLSKSVEGIMDLQLELDILKIILEEERSHHSEQEEMAKSLNTELQLSKEMVASVTKEYEKVQEELNNAKLVVEALESEQLQSINEIEDLRNSNVRYEAALKEKELEIFCLKEQASWHEFKDVSSCEALENEVSPLEAKLKKMHESLEKTKRLNNWYQSDLAFQASREEEMEEARKQVEVETAEVIVCLQEELSGLQQDVRDSKTNEMETKNRLAQLQSQMKIMEDNLQLRSEDNSKLLEMLEDKEKQLRALTEEWDLIASEIEGILSDGYESLKDVTDTDVNSGSLPHQRSWISEQFGRMKQHILKKELCIDELNQCLKDAVDRRDDVERMLNSLRGAVLLITESHQQECNQKDKEILVLTSDVSSKMCTVAELQSLIKHGEDQLKKASSCAIAAFVIVDRLWELNSNYQDALNNKDVQIREFKEIIRQKDMNLYSQASIIDEADKEIQSLQKKVEASGEYCAQLSLQLSEVQRHREALETRLEKDEENKILETREQLQGLKSGVCALKLCMNDECKSWVSVVKYWFELPSLMLDLL